MRNKIYLGALFLTSLLFDYFHGTVEGAILALDPIITGSLIAGGSSLLGGLLGGKSKSVTQVPLQTPEQAAARQALLDIFRTGRFGEEGSELQLGEDLGLPSGFFDVSPEERLGIDATRERFLGGPPSSLTQAIESALSFLDDPTIDPAGTFEPFKTRVERELQDRSDELRRQAAFTGDLFSTSTVQGLGDVQARGQEVLSEQLANLTNQSLDRRLQAAGQTGSLASLLEAIETGRISDLLGVGGIERNLQNQQVGQQREDLLRQRAEGLSRVDALGSIVGSPTQFGIPSISVPQPSPFQGVLDFASQIGGNIVGNKLFMDQIKALQPQVATPQPMFSGGGFGRFTGPLSLPGFS